MKSILTGLLIVGLALAADAQISIGEKARGMERIYFGGGFGLNGGRDYYGNRYFYFQVSPIVGYMMTPSLSAGTGLTYARISYPDLGLHTSQYGGSPFVRYNINQFFGMLEYNFISVDPVPDDDSNKRETYDRLFAGIGMSQPIGKRASINVVALYDLIYEPTGVFNSPWEFRVFFGF